MQNKFTRGILERQEREHKKQQLERPATALTAESTAIETNPIPAQEATTSPTSIPETISQPPLSDHLCDYIDRDHIRKAKNKTFYLDHAVIQAIKRASTAQHVTESKLVNDILKKILLSR